MKFERLEIANNIDKKKNDVIKMSANNKNFYKYWAVTDCLDCVIC